MSVQALPRKQTCTTVLLNTAFILSSRLLWLPLWRRIIHWRRLLLLSVHRLLSIHRLLSVHRLLLAIHRLLYSSRIPLLSSIGVCWLTWIHPRVHRLTWITAIHRHTTATSIHSSCRSRHSCSRTPHVCWRWRWRPHACLRTRHRGPNRWRGLGVGRVAWRRHSS